MKNGGGESGELSSWNAFLSSKSVEDLTLDNDANVKADKRLMTRQCRTRNVTQAAIFWSFFIGYFERKIDERVILCQRRE